MHPSPLNEYLNGRLGYAQMTTLVCGWLDSLSQEDGALTTARPALSPHDEAHFMRVRTQLIGLRGTQPQGSVI